MAQFRVYRLPDGMLVLDLQSDLIETGSRVVAPLIPESAGPESAGLRAITRLEPVFEIAGARLALHTAELAAVPARLVARDPVTDLSQEDTVIRGALDMLFSGF